MHKSFGKTENIIDRVISKFKMVKRGSLPTTSENQAELPENKNSSDKGSNDGHPENPESEEIIEDRKISLKDLPGFCDQLEKFIKYIQNIHNLQFLINDYPVILRNRFDNDVLELESMLREINAALTNIKRQKAQSNCVKNEKKAIKKSLNKIRENEFREMEKVIALHDKTLFTRWESVKTTHKPELLRNLLTDIKCKQLALENLDTLVTRKLGHLEAFSSIKVDRNANVEKEKIIIPLPFSPISPAISENSNQRKSRIPLPPPLPPPPSLASRNAANSFSMQRRRLEIENLENEYSLMARDIDTFLIIPPLEFENIPDNLITTMNENARNASYFSNDDSASRDYSIAASFQDEMRAVLQVSDDFSHSI